MALSLKESLKRSCIIKLNELKKESDIFEQFTEEDNNKDDNNDINKDNYKDSITRKKLFNNVILTSHKTEINNIKKFKRKNTNKLNFRKYPATLIIKKGRNFFLKSLIKIDKDISINNNLVNDKKGIQNKSFYIKSRIKEKLLKDYNENQRYERKYRDIKKVTNLYDSLDDIEENDDLNEGLNFNIPSDSTFVFIFDLILVFFSFYTLFFIPLSLAKRKYFCEKEVVISMVPKYFTEIVFMMDILISFFKSYYNYELKKITLTKKIIKHYLRYGFISDLISGIPSYIISRIMCNKKKCDFSELSNIEILLSLLLILKTIKISKVLSHKKNRVIEFLYESISEFYYLEQLLNTIIYIILCLAFFHTLICIHIFLGENNYPNWLSLIRLQNGSFWTKYLSSFYFMITTMTTVGYGDIICVSPIERNFHIVLLAIGTVIYSFIITKFGNYIEKKNDIQIELNNKENLLEQIRLSYPLMPFKLYYKIHNYLLKKAHKQQNNKNFEIYTLVNSLPDKLRNDILLTIYKNVINNFKIFKDCKNSDFIIKMLTSFIQTTCKKDTILMLEGQKIDNIIFVKDGRLILEATIDLNEPLKSVQKYFKENFNNIEKDEYIKDEYPNKRYSLASKSELNAEENAGKENEEKNLTMLREKLDIFIENNSKNVNNKFTTYVIDNKNENSFQIGINNKSSEDGEAEGSLINKNEEHCQFLKILDIRKNEYFGDVYMFLERPAPLTLKVKSKIAEIFALKKKDALNINKNHFNIMKRIQTKSFKNLISIKKKTLKTLKNFCDTNKFKNDGTNMKDISWFNEKSKNISIMDKTSFSNTPKENNNNIYIF